MGNNSATPAYYCWVGFCGSDPDPDPKGIEQPWRPRKKQSLVPPPLEEAGVGRLRAEFFQVDRNHHKPNLTTGFDVSDKAFRTEEEAVKWIRSGDGEVWRGKALNWVLVGFGFELSAKQGSETPV